MATRIRSLAQRRVAVLALTGVAAGANSRYGMGHLARALRAGSFRSDPQSWTANIRASKMGRLLRALRFAQAASARQIPVIIGAHVGEASLLTRAALPVAKQAMSALLAQEGAFGTHLLAHDICQPPLMFVESGILRGNAGSVADRPGWGIEPPLLGPESSPWNGNSKRTGWRCVSVLGYCSRRVTAARHGFRRRRLSRHQ